MSKVDLNAIGIKPLNSFEQLVVGPNNQVAVSACQAILQSPGETYNPLFIYGPAGVGKTHLMQAVAQEMLKKNPSAKVRYLSAERFMSETLMAISDDRIMDVRRAFGQLDLLVLDDVQYLGESKISQEELIHVFNNLHQENHQLLLAADRSPNQLTTLSQTLRTRFEWGLATDVHVPDMPTRIEILKKKQLLQDIHLDDDMLAYVAERLRSNVRELEGFLKRMHAYITLSHQTLSMDLVRSVVSEISPEAGAATREPDAMAKRPAPREPVAPPPPPPEAPRAPAKESAKEKSKAAAPPPPPPPAVPKEIDEEIERPISMASNGDIRSGRPAAAPPPPPPPAPVEPPKPAAIVPEVIIPDEPVPDAGSDAATGDDAAGGLKEVSAVFFYPAGQEEELEIVHSKFQEVIKKHKLKFRLRRAHSEGYEIKGKVNYSSFVDVCKMHRVAVAIVIGPKSGSHLPEQDFYDLLTVTLDVQGISLQLINWGEINKDYRYLNLALDIALVRSR